MPDFNGAEQQRDFGVIPSGTIVTAIMTVRPGGRGDGGWLKPTNDGQKLMVDAEFTIFGGPYDRRKFWHLFTVEGNVESKAYGISRGQLRAAIESSLNIAPSDNSQAAMAARSVPSYGSFDGLPVCIKLSVEKGDQGHEDKNRVGVFVTPDMKGYINPRAGGAPQGGQQQQSLPLNGGQAQGHPGGGYQPQTQNQGNPAGGRPSWAS